MYYLSTLLCDRENDGFTYDLYTQTENFEYPNGTCLSLMMYFIIKTFKYCSCLCKGASHFTLQML